MRRRVFLQRLCKNRRRACWRARLLLLVLLSWMAMFCANERPSFQSGLIRVSARVNTAFVSRRRIVIARPRSVKLERRSKPFDTAADGSMSASRNDILKSKRSKRRRRLIPPHALDDLASANVQFPYTCRLLDDNEPKKPIFWKPGQHKQEQEEETVNSSQRRDNGNTIMTVRLLQGGDIQTVTDMCCEEYGVGEAALGMSQTASTAIRKVDFQSLNRLLNQVVEDFMLRTYVDWTMRLKVVAAASSMNNHDRTQPPPDDHAILLLTLLKNNGAASVDGSQDSGETVVGIVEVSRQPPIPEHNPSAFPIPLFIKQMHCWWWSVSRQRQQLKRQADDKSTFPYLSSTTKESKPRKPSKMMQPEGWITNVLVAPEFRGQGWSKVLVHACEGVARSWNVPAIHLHCDANGVSGRVPQALYMSMGYTYRDEGNIEDDDDDDEYHWLRLAAESAEAASPSTSTRSSEDDDSTPQPAMCSSSVYVIEGVPLLYLKKDL